MKRIFTCVLCCFLILVISACSGREVACSLGDYSDSMKMTQVEKTIDGDCNNRKEDDYFFQRYEKGNISGINSCMIETYFDLSNKNLMMLYFETTYSNNKQAIDDGIMSMTKKYGKPSIKDGKSSFGYTYTTYIWSDISGHEKYIVVRSDDVVLCRITFRDF